MLTFRSSGISLEEASHKAPAIFAENPHYSRSANYSHIPTVEIVKLMEKEDFNMVSVSQSLSKRFEKQQAAKHIIRFRHKDVSLSTVGDEQFEICVINSHDGTTALSVHAGLFRLVCSNGLVVGSSTYSNIKAYHRNLSIETVVEHAYNIVKNIKVIEDTKTEWQAKQLTYDEKYQLATAAYKMKYDDRVTAFTPESFLKVNREEDYKNDLWTVFNIIQENLINGGLTVIRNNRQLRTRGINNIYQNVKFNQELWNNAADLMS